MRVVFIDWANIFANWNVDTLKFRAFLDAKFGKVDIVYTYMVDFSALSKRTDPKEARRSSEGFWNRLRNDGFRPQLKSVKVIQRNGQNDLHKANWDVGMTIDILKAGQSGKVNEIILLSGDGDFEPLLQEVRNPPHLVKVVVMAQARRTAGELRRCCDEFIDLEPLMPTFAVPFERRPRRDIVEEAEKLTEAILIEKKAEVSEGAVETSTVPTNEDDLNEGKSGVPEFD